MKPKYTIVIAKSREELITHVNSAITNGYWPQGAPGTDDDGIHFLWFQAMVLLEGA